MQIQSNTAQATDRFSNARRIAPSRDATGLCVTLDKSLLSYPKQWVNCWEIQIKKSQRQRILELERAVLKSFTPSSFHCEVSKAKFLGERSSLEPTPANPNLLKLKPKSQMTGTVNDKEDKISKFSAKCKPATFILLSMYNFISNQYCFSNLHT